MSGPLRCFVRSAPPSCPVRSCAEGTVGCPARSGAEWTAPCPVGSEAGGDTSVSGPLCSTRIARRTFAPRSLLRGSVSTMPALWSQESPLRIVLSLMFASSAMRLTPTSASPSALRCSARAKPAPRAPRGAFLSPARASTRSRKGKAGCCLLTSCSRSLPALLRAQCVKGSPRGRVARPSSRGAEHCP